MNRSLATMVCATLPGFFALISASEKNKPTPEPPTLVTIQPGDLPIILSAPHGGKRAVPGVTQRKGEGVARFKILSDEWTDQLTAKLADEIENKTGKRPYMVIANFHRKFIDANRPPHLAYETEKAKPVYDAYHEALTKARREVIDRFGAGLVLDIHGQAAELDTIIRGTQNGKTTAHLIERFGRDSLTGKSSLFGQIADHGLAITPPVDSQKKENPAYDGGHIVITYGSMKGGTVDAIQLELGRNLRRPEAATETAKKLAAAIHDYSAPYLPKW